MKEVTREGEKVQDKWEEDGEKENEMAKQAWDRKQETPKRG